MMHFRKQSIADSVTQRITAIADHIRTGSPLPPSRGSAVISLNRVDNGDLLVTKKFENGITELLTISNSEPAAQTPEGLTDVTPGGDGEAEAEPLEAGADSGDVVRSAALGGDSLDALLKT